MSHQFDTNSFLKRLKTGWVGRHFWYFESLESTNSYLSAKEVRNTPQGLVCLCDEQTSGKGQYGKEWYSQAGANLTFSVVFRPSGNQCLRTLGLACAYSAADLVSGCVSSPVFLKYPNDIYAGSHKIGGILTEASFNGNKPERIIAGIGLNVHQQAFPDDITTEASSIGGVANGTPIPSREELLASLLNRIETNYHLWEARQDEFLRQINRTLYGYGRWVYLCKGDEVLELPYKLLGVNNEGGLCVLNKDLDVEVFTHEQVRVHGFAETN